MAQQTSIKTVFETLCNLCKKLNFSKITPEVFRQAKFDSSEACKPLWVLLFELLYYATYKKTQTSPPVIEDIIIFVRAVFHDLGYQSKKFFQSPPLSGSRPLLIAFGWLVGRYRIIDLLIDNAESHYLNQLLGRIHGEEASPYDRYASLNLTDSLDYLLVCYNRCGMEWKSLRQLFQFIVRQALGCHHQIEADCSSSQKFFDNTTVVDLLAISGVEMKSEEGILFLEKHHKLLTVYLKWLKCQDIFWKWMGSVVDSGRREETEDGHAEAVLGDNMDSKNIARHSQLRQQDGEADFYSRSISELSDIISRLIQIILMVNWVKQDCKRHHQVSRYSSVRPFSGCDEVQNLIDSLCCVITEIEQRQNLLDDSIKEYLTLENDTIMEDIVHLPLPRK